MARWKAPGRLPISANWTFFASSYGWGAMSGYWSKFLCLKRGGSLWAQVSGRRGSSTNNILFHRPTGLQVVTFGIKFSLHVETIVFNSQQLFPLCLLIYIIYSLPVMLIASAVTVSSVLWLFQSHAAVVNRYNALCVKLTANTDIEQNNSRKSTFPVYVSKHFAHLMSGVSIPPQSMTHSPQFCRPVPPHKTLKTIIQHRRHTSIQVVDVSKWVDTLL